MTGDRSWAWIVALAVAMVETVALLANTIAIGVAARNSQGATVTATVPELVVYVLFAALLGLIAASIWRRASMVRTPYLIAQVFGLIVGYTVFVGGTTTTRAAGIVILGVSALGLVAGLAPSFVATLAGGRPSGSGQSG